MAQLPPKIPTIAPNWPSFPHQKISSTMPDLTRTNNTLNAQQSPSWVDEFFDFSSARRGAHRRSASDSITFLETPFLEECRNSAPTMMSGGAHGFDRLDDDQLMSMFSDDIASVALPPPPQLSNPSTPNSSEQNSNNDEKPMTLDVPLQDNNNNNNNNNQQKQKQPKNEPEEVDSSCKNDTPAPPPSTTLSGVETIVDPKRVKR